MFADFKVFAIFSTLAFVWIPLVRGDSSDMKCYDSGIGGWKTLGSQKEDYEEVSCPDGTCKGTWTAEPGKDEKKGVLSCEPSKENKDNLRFKDRNQGSCEGYEHQCPSGTCIWTSSLCDGHGDCGDSYQNCDGYNNCEDSSDERNCSDWKEYRNKTGSVEKTMFTLLGSLLSTTEKISASGSGNYFGVSLNGKGTGYIADLLLVYMFAEEVPFSHKRNVKLEINANVGAGEFQVKLDQEFQFDKEKGERSELKINEKEEKFDLENVCVGQPQVCTIDPRTGYTGDLEAFEKAALKEFGSNKEVTLTLGKEINFRITGNLKPVVEKYQKVRKLYTEARKQNPSIIRSPRDKDQKTKEAEKALKNAIEEIIGDITLVANGNVEIDGSTRAEVNINVNSKEILNQYILGESEKAKPEYAYSICTEKKCLSAGQCTKNLCNHPEKFEEIIKTKLAELSKSSSSVGIVLGVLAFIFVVAAIGFLLFKYWELVVDFFNKNCKCC